MPAVTSVLCGRTCIPCGYNYNSGGADGPEDKKCRSCGVERSTLEVKEDLEPFKVPVTPC